MVQDFFHQQYDKYVYTICRTWLVEAWLILPYFCLAYKSCICVCIWMILNLVVLVMMKQILHRNDKKKTNGTFSNSES